MTATLPDITKAGIPVAIALSLLGGAVLLGVYLDKFRADIVLEVRDVGYRITSLERNVDQLSGAQVNLAEMRLWVAEARGVFPELPEFP